MLAPVYSMETFCSVDHAEQQFINNMEFDIENLNNKPRQFISLQDPKMFETIEYKKSRNKKGI